MPRKKTSCGEPKVSNVYHGDCRGIQKVLLQERSSCKSGQHGQIRAGALAGKNVTRVMTSEGVKQILIPSGQPNYYPIKLTSEEMKRLGGRAVLVTEEERLRLCQEDDKHKQRLKEESTKRKLKFQMIDQAKVGDGSKLTAMQEEAKDKANYLLERAWELLQENEDEVKVANSLILKTKCQAIRDAQIAERRLIQKELTKEKHKEGQNMEQERQKQVEEEYRKKEEERVKHGRYVRELNLQIADNEATRLIEAERIIEERRRANEAMFHVMFEEQEKLKVQQKEKEALKEALDQANSAIRHAQEIEKEESRIADLKMQEFMRLRADREERIEQDKKEAARKKEMETARLRALQEQAGDLKAVLDEQAAVRRQEEYEREWRKKEIEAALKKKKVEEQCKVDRDKQVDDIRRVQAMEMGREKREYEHVLKVQMSIQEKEKQAEMERKKRIVKYREEILKQINEKERERVDDRRNKYAEGLALRTMDAKRKVEINKVLAKKVDCLRQNKIPEMYINEIKRQLCI